MSEDPDYSAIPIPEDKPPEEYDYTERRAAIFRRIEEKGYPWGFNYSALGREFGVSHEMIRKDFARIRDWYGGRIGEGAKASTDLAYRRIVREHMESGDFEKARRALDSWNEWLQETGEQQTAPDEVDHRHAHKHDHEEVRSLSETQLQHIDAMTGGSGEIEVEAVETVEKGASAELTEADDVDE